MLWKMEMLLTSDLMYNMFWVLRGNCGKTVPSFFGEKKINSNKKICKSLTVYNKKKEINEKNTINYIVMT